jgi:hypothetical protein
VLVVLLAAPASRRWGWIPLATAGALIVLLAVLDLVSISDASDLRERLARVPGCAQVVQCTGDRSAGIGVYLTILGGLLVLIGALLHAGAFERARRRVRPAGTPGRADGRRSEPVPASVSAPAAGGTRTASVDDDEAVGPGGSTPGSSTA